ncbi:MAG: BREX system ATP-binding domain-containing protein [Actinomycetota bacterium]|nr:BREX system ATP-binding domain-containing protein [Actinomycetota bacterium]
MGKLVIRLLGPFGAERDGRAVAIGLSDARLLAALALPRDPIARAELAASVLHLSPTTIGPQLSRLARTLGVARLHEVSAPRSGRIRLAGGIAEVDALTYRDRAERALAAADRVPPGRDRTAGRDVLDELLAADDLWGGPVDPALDLDTGDHPVAAAIAELHALRARHRTEARRRLLAAGDPGIDRLERWAHEAPDDAAAWHALLDRALDGGGPDAASAQVESWEALLAAGPAPDPPIPVELAAAHARVRAERLLGPSDGTDAVSGRDDRTVREPVGRRPAVERLDELVDTVAGRHGAIVTIAGRAGTGKTLLLDRTSTSATARGVSVVRIDLEEVSSVHTAWTTALGARWREGLADERARRQLVRLVDGVETLFGWRAPTGDEPADVAATVARLAADVLRITARARPLLIVLDNAHRAGPELDEALARLGPALRTLPCGIVVAFRPDELTGGRRLGDHEPSVELGPLDEDDAVSLLREVRGLDLSPTEYRRAHAMTGGVPLALMAFDVADLAPPAHAIGRSPDAAGTDAGADRAEAAEPAVDVLRATVARLGEDERYALGLAALAGHGTFFDPDLVAELAHGDRSVVDALERELDRAVIVVRADGRGRFSHRRWQELAYDALGPEIPPIAHGQAFAHLLRRGAPPGAVADHAAAIAHHASRSGRAPIDRTAAVHHLVETADQLAGCWEYGLAMTLYGTALDLATTDERYDILLARARCARLAARWDDAERDLTEAADWAAYRNDAPREAEALLSAAMVTWDPSRLAGTLASRLRNVLERLGPELVTLRWRVAACLGGGLYQDGSSALTPDLAPIVRDATARPESIRPPQQRAEMLMWARKALMGHVTARESLALTRRMARAAEASTFLRANALLAAVVDLVRLGRHGPARRVSVRYGELAERTSSPVHAYVAATLDGLWALADGSWDAADEAIDRAGRLGVFGGLTSMQVVYGQRLWLDRERGVVDGDAELAIRVAAMLPADGAIPLWTTVGAWLHAHGGDHELAERTLAAVAGRTGGFRDVTPGAMRVGFLALAAETVALITAGRGPGGDPSAWAAAIERALAAEPDRCVLIGWPTVILGPRLRYEGLAARAAGAFDRADGLLAAAREAPWCTPAFAGRITAERDANRLDADSTFAVAPPYRLP